MSPFRSNVYGVAERLRRERTEQEKERARERAREWYASPEGKAKRAAYLEKVKADPERAIRLREQQRKSSERYRQADPERHRRIVAKHRRGITDEEWHALKDHSGICEACGEESATDIDYDHSTHTFRGFLCHGCNTAAGFLSDSPERAEALAQYLRRSARRE